jgi:hypothetical protein
MTPNSNPSNPNQLSRRQALKAATAIGGALAASSMLPDQWTKPVIGAGVLPAHAQASQICPERMASEVDFQGAPLTSSIPTGTNTFLAMVQVYPATAGVPLHLTVTIDGSVDQEHDVSTNASGQASVNVTLTCSAGQTVAFGWTVDVDNCQTSSYRDFVGTGQITCPNDLSCDVYYNGAPLTQTIPGGTNEFQTRAQVSPAMAGIPLHLLITLDGVTYQEHDLTTNASGQAYLNVTLTFTFEVNVGFTWTVTLDNCDVSCSHTYFSINPK